MLESGPEETCGLPINWRYSRTHLHHSIDLIDAKWATTAPVCANRVLAPATTPLVDVIDTERIRPSAAWRLPFQGVPPKSTVCDALETGCAINPSIGIDSHPVVTDRERSGREPSPTNAIVDSCSPTSSGEEGCWCGAAVMEGPGNHRVDRALFPPQCP